MKGSRFSVGRAKALVLSLSVGAAGGVLFHIAGLPLAWMLGPLVANLLVSAKGVKVEVPESLRSVFLAVMGMVLGSQVTPELAYRVLDWPVSAMLLLAGVASSTAVAPAKPCAARSLVSHRTALRAGYGESRPAKLGHEPNALGAR